MFERGYASRSEFETAQGAVTSAELDLARANGQLEAGAQAAERAIIRARFPGLVAKVFHAEGDLITPSGLDPVLRVIDPTRLEVALNVAVVDLPKLQVGQPATVFSPAGIEPATIVQRQTPSDPNATSQEIRLAFDVPTATPVDSAVQVEVLLGEHANVVTLPTTAVVSDDGRSYVVIAGEDGLAHRREVRLGPSSGGRVVIVSGLEAGEQVVVSDVTNLEDGTPISG
jgi:RND family efflux transporter MFP subunit